MLKVINGYPCRTGCEADLARKGIDPRNPRQDPARQEILDARDPRRREENRSEEARRLGPLQADGARIDGVRVIEPVAASERARGPGRVLDRRV